MSKADNDSVDRRLLAGVEALLGRTDEAHPTGGEILALVEGALLPGQAASVRSHLETCGVCKGLMAAAQQGLDALARVAGTTLPAPTPLRLGQFEQPRALAADGDAELAPAPLPADRRELLVGASGVRAVYFRRQGRAKVGLFGPAIEAALLLEGRSLQPQEQGDDFMVFDVGPLSALHGRLLEVRLAHEVRRFTLEGE